MTMHYSKKTGYSCALFLLLIFQYNYAYNFINSSNEIIISDSKKEITNLFYDNHEANWKNIENFNANFSTPSNIVLNQRKEEIEIYSFSTLTNFQTENTPAGSYLIAIVDALQGGSNFNLKAYGLIVRLLNADDPLKWAIKSGKSKDGRDFSVNASRIKPSSLGSPSRNFKSGPIIVYPGFESQALAVINAYGNNVRVYQMYSSKNIEIYADLMHKPKAAVLNNGGKADIHKDIYSDVGLTLNMHYVQENSAANINGNSCYTFVSSPHTKPNQTKPNQTKLILHIKRI